MRGIRPKMVPPNYPIYGVSVGFQTTSCISCMAQARTRNNLHCPHRSSFDSSQVQRSATRFDWSDAFLRPIGQNSVRARSAQPAQADRRGARQLRPFRSPRCRGGPLDPLVGQTAPCGVQRHAGCRPATAVRLPAAWSAEAFRSRRSIAAPPREVSDLLLPFETEVRRLFCEP